ncbi:hypothetical protein CPC08DRAFT_299648 [Agrocybe pediades]|nr:hypothetical protein CPC08DRAFT_299648 [Agrocybe pediades]
MSDLFSHVHPRGISSFASLSLHFALCQCQKSDLPECLLARFSNASSTIRAHSRIDHFSFLFFCTFTPIPICLIIPCTTPPLFHTCTLSAFFYSLITITSQNDVPTRIIIVVRLVA